MSHLDQYDIQELKSKNQELRDKMNELEEKYKKLEEKQLEEQLKEHNMCLIKYKMLKKIQQLERSIDSRNRHIEYLKSVQCGIKKGEKCLNDKSE